MSPVQLAAVLAAVILVASTVSVELGVTVALLELTLGVAAGNLCLGRCVRDRVELAVDGEALERHGLDLAHALARDSQLPPDRLE